MSGIYYTVSSSIFKIIIVLLNHSCKNNNNNKKQLAAELMLLNFGFIVDLCDIKNNYEKKKQCVATPTHSEKLKHLKCRATGLAKGKEMGILDQELPREFYELLKTQVGEKITRSISSLLVLSLLAARTGPRCSRCGRFMLLQNTTDSVQSRRRSIYCCACC